MKASTIDIRFYKGVILQRIHSELTKVQAISIDELDEFLKHYADLDLKSCSDMTHDEMQILKEWSKQFAMSIGVDIDDNNEINLNF